VNEFGFIGPLKEEMSALSSASMLKRLNKYADTVHPFPDKDAFFFP
jgi:hypothetical protein